MMTSLCETCENVRAICTARSTFLLCELSATSSAYPKYPPQPVVRCAGYRPQPGRHEAVALEQFGAEQVGVPGERGVRLVRRVAGPGRAEGEYLPPALPHHGEGFDPPEGGRAEVADAERPGQTGRVQEDAGRPGRGGGGHRGTRRGSVRAARRRGVARHHHSEYRPGGGSPMPAGGSYSTPERSFTPRPPAMPTILDRNGDSRRIFADLQGFPAVSRFARIAPTPQKCSLRTG